MLLQQTQTRLSLVLQEYRRRYDLKQEQLATDLNIDVRTLRRWEKNEAMLRDIHQVRQIAVRLSIDPERLGVVNAVALPFTCEELDGYVDTIWQRVYQARIPEACNMAQRLVPDLTLQIAGENDPRLSRLAQLHDGAGFVTSMQTRSSLIAVPLAHYQEMEHIARLLADGTLLTLALAYQGDMYCRGGEARNGIDYLEAARETAPHADCATVGHTAQLLGRAYLKRNRVHDFEREMSKAERLAMLIGPGNATTRGQYSLGTVYEEYAFSYPRLGKFDEALQYVYRAEEHLEPNLYWNILMKTTRARALVQNGDLDNGIPLALQATQLCRKHGLLRLLERMYALRRHLDGMSLRIRQVGLDLQEALDGLLEAPV